LLIIDYQWSNMGNRGFLHTASAPTMPTILLSSIKISLPADPVAVPPLQPGKFHIHSLFFSLIFIVLFPVFCSQIWTISSSWLAVGSRIREHQDSGLSVSLFSFSGKSKQVR
jgi:hypothetical protein